MSTYVRARRPAVARESTEPIIIRVDRATWIPSGMHGTGPTTYETATLVPPGMHSDFPTVRGNSPIERDMIARGIRPERARALVSRAAARIRRRRAGLGDDEIAGAPTTDAAAAAEMLRTVQSKGADYQNAHRSLIAQIPSAQSDADRLRIRNAVDGLYADWTTFAVDAKNGVAPFEWNRTDPIDAILIAVRADLRNTVDLIDANKAQQVLAKQITTFTKFGMPSKSGPLLDIDVPWYVWAGAAAASAAVAGKVLHLW